MPLYSTALSRILPPGSPAYLALLREAPDADGTGEVEASYVGYARVLHMAWATHQDVDDSWFVSNTGSIVFGAVAGAPVVVAGWGIYPSAVGGSLIASGLVIKSPGDPPSPSILEAGDQARFLDGALIIRGRN